MLHIVIPARYGSSRLSGKPLLMIAGMTMIERVYRQAEQSEVGDVHVATDDQRIFDAVERFGGSAIMTRTDHASGTDRLAEVCELKNWSDDDIVLNLQGDEPLMPSEVIRYLAELSAETDAGLSTLATPIHDTHDAFNPNVVKVVLDAQGKALYFSRATIPWYRDQYPVADSHDIKQTPSLRHLGMYAYRVSALKRILTLPACKLETAESLEQLRPLYHGMSIQVGVIEEAPAHGVDTPEDLQRVEALLKNN